MPGTIFPEIQRILNDPNVSDDRKRRLLFLITSADFWRCPNTGRILDATIGDDKVLCHCARVNPTVAAVGHVEAISPSGIVHHIKAYLKAATPLDFLKQDERDEKVRDR